ncbi:hypothetical protein NL676_005160 [Syzygium grande]|nr:hypothetical protein NL676_005160 [Syzygium grande]
MSAHENGCRGRSGCRQALRLSGRVLGPRLARFVDVREIHGGPGVVCLGGTARCGCFCLAKTMSDADSSGGRTTEGKMKVKSAEDVD